MATEPGLENIDDSVGESERPPSRRRRSPKRKRSSKPAASSTDAPVDGPADPPQSRSNTRPASDRIIGNAVRPRDDVPDVDGNRMEAASAPKTRKASTRRSGAKKTTSGRTSKKSENEARPTAKRTSRRITTRRRAKDNVEPTPVEAENAQPTTDAPPVEVPNAPPVEKVDGDVQAATTDKPRRRSSTRKRRSKRSGRTPAPTPESDIDKELDETTQFSYAPDASTTVVPEEPEPAPEKPKRPRRSSRPAAPKKTPEVSEKPDQPVTVPPLIKGGRQMVVNASSGDECRIAIVFNNRLEEFFIERQGSVSHVGNIYKGIITNVEPGIQAAFIDFGLAKHGFLHISDVQPQYFGDRPAEPEGVGQKVPRRDRPPIQKCFRRGQEVIVQVTKEGLGTKGPTLSTYLSIPGRYLVMMPGMSKLGVSRKIDDEDVRRKMRAALGELTLPKGMGFILRTAGQDRTKRDLQRDLNYLQRLWKLVTGRVRSTRAPAELYRESDLVLRTMRDVFTSDFDQIIVDSDSTVERVREFLRIATPRTSKQIVRHYDSPVPIFHHYRIEEQIEAIHSRHVPLKSGGSLVIESTEAMVTIDVNSGRLRNIGDEEGTAYKTNTEAADEIARQLRLRDLGGLIVCDFIDMRFDRHKRDIEKALRDELKKHKERARILRMSQFGLIEMTRQRRGPSIKRGIYADCPHCKGSGLVKSSESMTLHVLRNIQMAVHRDDLVRLIVTVAPDVATILQNRKRGVLFKLEETTGKVIIIRSDPSFTSDQQAYQAEDVRGRLTRLYADKTQT
jgi:Rne/Rng family ribonuclease